MKKLTFFAGIALVLFSCNSGGKGSSESNSENGSETIRSKEDGKTYDCLKAFEADYAKLLTKEEMNSVSPFDMEKAKKDLRSGSYGEHKYRWESDRAPIETTLLNQTIKGPDYNTIGIANLSFYEDNSDLKSNRDYFDRGYKTLSEQELKAIEENLAKQTDEVKESGTGFMEARKKMQWEFVDGIGSSAWYKWNKDYGIEMAVLAGIAKFDIILKVSDNPEENLALAKKLAEKVLEKCK